MKNLTLIVHAGVQQSLADTLRALPAVTSFYFTPVEGHGPQDSRDASLSVRDQVVGYVPHVRVDILLADRDIDAVLAALRASGSGVAGRGVYWVTSMDRQGPL